MNEERDSERPTRETAAVRPSSAPPSRRPPSSAPLSSVPPPRYSLSPFSDLKPVCQLRGYSVVGRISKSATGETYLAYRGERGSERWYSLKLLSAIVEHQPELLAKVDQEISRSEVLQHPSIVSVEDTVAAASQRLVVFPWVRGVALSAPVWHTRDGEAALRWDLAVYAFRAVCQALRDVMCEDKAGATRVHGAIIPQNIVVDASGEVYILNLGLDVLRAGAQDLSMVYPFRAPEVRASGKMTPAADVFGVGVCMLEMISVGSARKLLENPTETSDIVDAACARSGCPSTLSALVARAVAVDPARRFVSLASLAEALERVPVVPERADLQRELVISLRDERDLGFDRPPAMETADLRIADLAEKARLADLSTELGVASPPETADATAGRVTTEGLSDGVLSVPQPALPSSTRPGWLVFAVAALVLAAAGVGVWVVSSQTGQEAEAATSPPEQPSSVKPAAVASVGRNVAPEKRPAPPAKPPRSKGAQRSVATTPRALLQAADGGSDTAVGPIEDASGGLKLTDAAVQMDGAEDEAVGTATGPSPAKRRRRPARPRHKKKLLANPGF